MCLYLHPLFYRLRAGSNKPWTAFNFNNTHPACACWGEIFHPAECGYNNTIPVKGREYCFPLFGFYFLVVYFYCKKHILLIYCYCAKLTCIITNTTANTFIAYNKERLLPCAVNGTYRTFRCAGCTPCAFININSKCS